jgi:tetratricopeptide (TPR) repeat protein
VKVLGRIVILAATVVVCAWALWNWSVVPLQCNAALTRITASTRANETLPDYAKEQRANNNIDLLQKLRVRCKADVRVPFLIGVNESSAERHENAVNAFNEALKIDRRPEIYAAIASEQVLLGRTDEAIKNYLTAARFGAPIDEAGQSDEVWRRVQEQLRAR